MYFRTTLAFLLDAGIATWEDVKLTFNAAVHKPAIYITERLQLLERLWAEVGGTWLGQDFRRKGNCNEASALPEIASVAMLGLWSKSEQWVFKMVTSSCEDDVLASGPCNVDAAPGSPEANGVKVFKDYVTRQKVLSLSNMRPIHNICLENERVNVARTMLIAKRYVKQ